VTKRISALEYAMRPCTKCGGPRDTVGAQCKACKAAYGRRYRKIKPENPQYHRDSVRRQYARNRATPGVDVQHVDTSLIYDRDLGLCALCGTDVERDGPEQCFDHIIPMALGGSHTPDNLQLAHRSCNGWKGNHVQAIHLPLVESVNLAEHRHRCGLTQRGVADLIGVSVTTMTSWESGRYMPEPDKRPLLAQVLGISRLDLESSLHELDCLALPIGE
jgi:DNA-binding XRE family transcriptional regulator/5-methylcytosine-specific restriction endonuclease McrA